MSYGINTFLIMGDGSVKQAGEIRAGDYLMGPDSKPHKVISSSGKKAMLFKVNYEDGFFTCTADQLLFLQDKARHGEYYKCVADAINDETIVRARGIDFPERPVKIDSYEMGILYGNQRYIQRLYDNKVIDSMLLPKNYIYNSRNIRMEFFNALIDTYGEIRDGILKIRLPTGVADIRLQTLFLAKSLGASVWLENDTLVIDAYNGYSEPYLLDIFKAVKEPSLCLEINIEEEGEDYVSHIELEDNSLMLLDDFTIVPDSSGIVNNAVGVGGE